MASFVIPFERLVRPYNPDQPHPARDRERYATVRDSFEQLLEKRFLGSELWPSLDAGSWCFGTLSDVTHPSDLWPELQQPDAITRYKTISPILRTLRCGLAHGNLFLRGRPDIDAIVFLRQPNRGVYGFEYLMVSPDDFHRFLENWIGFLEGIAIPDVLVPDDFELAA
jgi:hypothetical protein